jgi:hypothetical protein
MKQGVVMRAEYFDVEQHIYMVSENDDDGICTICNVKTSRPHSHPQYEMSCWFPPMIARDCSDDKVQLAVVIEEFYAGCITQETGYNNMPTPPQIPSVQSARTILKQTAQNNAYKAIAQQLYIARPIDKDALPDYIAGIVKLLDCFSYDPRFNIKEFMDCCAIKVESDGLIKLLPF